MFTQKTADEMTREELLTYVKEMEALADNTVVSIGKNDIAHVLSGMLQPSLSDISSGKLELTEDDIPPDLLEVAKSAMRWSFGFENETEQISNFLSSLPIDWQALHNSKSSESVC